MMMRNAKRLVPLAGVVDSQPVPVFLRQACYCSGAVYIRK